MKSDAMYTKSWGTPLILWHCDINQNSAANLKLNY